MPKGVKILQVEGGDSVRLDFLPYVVTEPHHPCRSDERGIAIPGTLWYRRPYKLHRSIGATNESVICLTSIGKRCPICDYRLKLIRERKGDSEEVRALRPSDRNLYVVVPLGHRKYEEVPHIFDISRWCFQDLLRDETKVKPQYESFPEPTTEGFTVLVRFSEERVGTRTFPAASRIDFEPRKHGYDAEYLRDVPKLDDVLLIMSYKELEALFFEGGTDGAAPHVPETAPEDVEPEDVLLRRRRIVDAAEVEPVRHREPVEAEPAPHHERVPSAQTQVSQETWQLPAVQLGFKEQPQPSLPESERRMLRRRKRQEEDAKSGRCPFGHQFGSDCDRFPNDCNDCKVWDECFDASGEGSK